MESVAWKLKIPVDRNGGVLNFTMKELGIDQFLAVKSLIKKEKFREAILCFFKETIVPAEGCDQFESLQKEFDKNNLIPFISSQNVMMEMLEPIESELKKN